MAVGSWALLDSAPDTGTTASEEVWAGRPATLADVDGRTFELVAVELHGEAGEIAQGAHPVGLLFFDLLPGDFRGERKALAVGDGCNTATGPYSIGPGGLLTVEGQVMSLVGCIDPVAGQRFLVHMVVATGAIATVDGDRLRISKGGVDLTFERQPARTPEEVARDAAAEEAERHAECLEIHGPPPSAPVATFRVTLPDGTVEDTGSPPYDNAWVLTPVGGALDLDVEAAVADGAGVRELTYVVRSADGRGHIVRTLSVSNDLTKGGHHTHLQWDLRSDDGQLMGPGVYPLSAVANVDVDSRRTCDQFTGYTEGYSLGYLEVPQ